MGARAVAVAITIASAAAVAAAAMPLPSRAAQVLAAGLGIALALHGLGRLVAHRDLDAPAPLAIAWGLAAYLAIAGWLAAAGALGPTTRIGLGLVGLSAGIAWAWRRPSRSIPPPTATWWIVFGVVAVVLSITTLTAVGASGWSDGDGHLAGALARLDGRGALDDLIGYPRRLGLGGSVTLAGLGVALPDRGALPALDGGLAMALAVALLLERVARAPRAPYVAIAVLLLSFGVPTLPPALLPRWTTVALALALLSSLERPRAQPLVIAMIAAALATLGHAGFGVALGAIVFAGPARGRTAAVVSVCAAGYVVALVGAAGPAALPWLAPGFGSRALAGIALATVAWSLVGLITRGHADPPRARWQALVALALGAAVATAPGWPQAGLLAAPWLLALILIVSADVLARAERTAGAVVVAFAVVMIPAGLRFRLGVPPQSWGDRLAMQLDELRAGANHATSIETARSYRAALAVIPDGARIAVWVDAPELVDMTRLRVIDLRSAAAAACLGGRSLERPPAPTCRRLAIHRGTVDVDYLVVSLAVPLPPDDPLAARLDSGVRVVVDSDLQVIAVTAATADAPPAP